MVGLDGLRAGTVLDVPPVTLGHIACPALFGPLGAKGVASWTHTLCLSQ